MMIRLLRFGLVTAVFLIGTVVGGWWTVPLVALVAARRLPRRDRPGVAVPVAAGLAWLLLLARAAWAPGFAELAAVLAALSGVPLVGLVSATLGFAVLLATGAAMLGRALLARPLPPRQE